MKWTQSRDVDGDLGGWVLIAIRRSVYKFVVGMGDEKSSCQLNDERDLALKRVLCGHLYIFISLTASLQSSTPSSSTSKVAN